jgi:hypothetical protein
VNRRGDIITAENFPAIKLGKPIVFNIKDFELVEKRK